MGSPAGRHRCRFEATFCDPPLSLPSDCSVLPGERCVLWWCSMLKGTPECGVAQDMSSLALKFSQGAALLRLRCASQFIEKWKEFSSLGKNSPKVCDLSSLCSANIQFSQRFEWANLQHSVCSALHVRVPARVPEGTLMPVPWWLLRVVHRIWVRFAMAREARVT